MSHDAKPAASQIQLTINGAPHTLPAGSSVADAVRRLGIQPTQVAVERNKSIVRRVDHATTVLADGDRLEIVTLFGGG